MTPAPLSRIQSALISTYHTWVYWGASECPPTLFAALARELPHIEARYHARLVSYAGTFVNGVRALEDVELRAPCRIEFYEPKYDVDRAEELFPPFSAMQVVYRDRDLAVVFKPAGLPTLPGRDQSRFSLKHQLEDYFGGDIHLPSRVDMSTCGLVLFSLHPDMHSRLQRLFETRSLKKYYLLEASGNADFDQITVERAIGKDRSHPVLRTVVDEGGKPAITTFTRIESRLHQYDNESFVTTLLEARPVTGRTHQIRVHAKSLGLPIVGDNFYAGLPAPTLRLMSARLMLRHPRGGELLDVIIPDKLAPEWALSSGGQSVFTSFEGEC